MFNACNVRLLDGWIGRFLIYPNGYLEVFVRMTILTNYSAILKNFSILRGTITLHCPTAIKTAMAGLFFLLHDQLLL